MHMPKALIRAAVVAWVSLLPLAGCSTLPDTAPIAAMPQQVIEPVEDVLPGVLPAELPPVVTTRMLRIFGHVTLPKAVDGLANTKDGAVIGAPVVLRDVPTGRKLGSAVTFYDGSFFLDVAADVGKRPVVLTVDLIDAKTRAPLFPLAAPLQLAPELAEQHVEIGPATTAWYALLYSVAARKTKAPPPDWTVLVPGVTTRTLGGLIVGSKANAVDSFSLLASGDGGIMKPETPTALRAAIQRLVDRLVSTARPATEQERTP
ncbi:MAG: hypothetical protein JWM80_932 [Cyanobacteria bacterium RYN_339]|nr:hypothetical protein [Cyanobacteria bacterium RYN_339]